MLGSIGLLIAAACQQEPAPKAAMATPPAGPAPGTPEWKIANAESAAPAAISSKATIMDWPATPTSQMTQLRAGTNGWMCLPDMADTPGNDPMCADGVWQEWAQAWMAHKPFSTKVAGLAYMLQGGAGASNTDPFKMKPDSGQSWLMAPAHTMLISPDVASIAKISDDPNNGGPWVMFKGTPYVHVMVPVGK
jgi:hypothetical protein